jgi:hypothetical protein
MKKYAALSAALSMDLADVSLVILAEHLSVAVSCPLTNRM